MTKRIQSSPMLGRKKSGVRDRTHDGQGWRKEMKLALNKALRKRGDL